MRERIAWQKKMVDDSIRDEMRWLFAHSLIVQSDERAREKRRAIYCHAIAIERKAILREEE